MLYSIGPILAVPAGRMTVCAGSAGERANPGRAFPYNASGWRATLRDPTLPPDAGERLRLDVLDAVDGRGHRALGDGDHAALDLVRRESVVIPDDRDDGDVDLGEDVDRGSHDRQHAADGDQQRHHDEGVRPAE